MSITPAGVKFNKPERKLKIILALLAIAETVFSIFLFISLASHLIFPEKSKAVAGIAKVLSYQGRLTDSSGNPLGGAGTDYCFKFSIYDDATVGVPDTRLWPTAAPTGASITVKDGVFDAAVGQADSLTYNFFDNDTVYLNVEVATKVGASCTDGDETFENLGARQRIMATGYSIAASNVYSDLLRTDNANNLVQIGSGAGAATPKLLGLDVKNVADTIGGTCTPSGTVWYNSNNTRALVCDNGVIRNLSNTADFAGIKESAAAATINAGTVVLSNDGGISINQSTATFATNQTNLTVGTLRFSNLNAFGISTMGNTLGTSGTATGTLYLAGGNNITLSRATAAGAQTITISANAGGGGGGGYTLADFANLSWRDFISNVTNMTALTQRPIFVPFVLPGSLTWNRGAIEVSRAAAGSNLFTMQAAIYTFVNSTQISRLASLQNTYSNTATASISGIRRILFTGIEAAGSTMTPGYYVAGLYFSAAATSSMNYSLRGGQTVGPPVGNIGPGANANTTATSQLSSVAFARFLGRYTTTTNAMPGSVAFSQVQQWTSNYPIYFMLEST